MKYTGALGAAAVAVLLTGCGSGSSGASHTTSPATITVTGDITVTGYDNSDGGESGGELCTTHEGYDDIAAGAQVVVSDDAGHTMGLGSLDYGHSSSVGCSFTFKVHGVNPHKKFYTVTVGHRDGPQYTRTKLDHPIHLTIGD